MLPWISSKFLTGEMLRLVDHSMIDEENGASSGKSFTRKSNNWLDFAAQQSFPDEEHKEGGRALCTVLL